VDDDSTTETVHMNTDAPACQLVAEAFGLRIAMTAADPELLQESVPWLPGGWNESSPLAALDRTYTLTIDQPDTEYGLLSYAFAVDGEPKYRSPSLVLFTGYLENDLHHYIATYTRGYLFVHAGVAVWHGRAIVIPGRSYTGKSILTRALLEAGAVYYSDDYAIIDDQGLVHPFPRHLRLRGPDSIPRNRVDPHDHGWPVGAGPAPIGLVAALRYDAELGWTAGAVSKGAGVLVLLSNTVAARERPIDALGVMARAVEHAVILEGTRGEAEEAVEQLTSMLSRTNVPSEK
jgi:hypothetical protein